MQILRSTLRDRVPTSGTSTGLREGDARLWPMLSKSLINLNLLSSSIPNILLMFFAYSNLPGHKLFGSFFVPFSVTGPQTAKHPETNSIVVEARECLHTDKTSFRTLLASSEYELKRDSGICAQTKGSHPQYQYDCL